MTTGKPKSEIVDIESELARPRGSWWRRRPVWVGLGFYALAGIIILFPISEPVISYLSGSLASVVSKRWRVTHGPALGTDVEIGLGGMLFLTPVVIAFMLALVWCWGRPGRGLVHAIGLGLIACELVAATLVWLVI